MASTRDTRTVMIVDSEPAQQRFLAALVSRGGWRSVDRGRYRHRARQTRHPGRHGARRGARRSGYAGPGYRRIRGGTPPLAPRPAARSSSRCATGSRSRWARCARGQAISFRNRSRPDRLLEALDRVVSTSGPQGELRPLTEKLRAPLAFEEIIGSSPNFRSALAIAAKAARARVPVMINGKPGTGKEVFARAIHSASPRAPVAQLVMVDCSAVSPGLIGSGPVRS